MIPYFARRRRFFYSPDELPLLHPATFIWIEPYDYKIPPFEISAVIFPDKMQQKTNSVTDGLCMALGMMMLSVCRPHRFDDGSAAKPLIASKLLVP